ncbi:MAG TPA: sulfatase-like hydrolase/transferase [Fimbriimonadaceae bacterium]|nr:sulfatase-like hydrolase/transferase [Fimbriimonadaceae bacterium]
MGAEEPAGLRKPKPYYPIFIAAFPVVAVYSLNLAMVPLGDIWRPLAISVGGVVSLCLVLSLLMRSVAKGAALGALVFVLFATFGSIMRYTGPIVLEIADALVIGFALYRLIRHKGNLAHWTRVANFGATVLIVLPLAQIVVRKPHRGADAYLHVSLPVHATASTVASRPDIFFIIVDGYGREDQLQRVMSYSNQPFVQQLRSRGFYVADQSHSNYVQTQLSLTATLNLSFLQDYPKTFPRDSDDRSVLLDGMDRSFIAAYLKRLGYAYISVTSGFNEVKFDSADVTYSGALSLTMIEDALVQLTPVTVVDQPITSLYDDRRKSLRGAFANLKYLATPAGGPRFVVAHILAPHPPFVFKPDGEDFRQALPFGFWDGSHYMSVGGTPDMYRTGYVNQVQYLNSQLLQIVDALVAKAGGKKPVIIIEGDHGSKLGLDQEIVEKTDLHEAFSNFMAFFVPDSVKALLYPKITSFNTFRALLDGLFGEKLPMLPDRSFYSPFSMPYRFTEVTDRVAD